MSKSAALRSILGRDVELSTPVELAAITGMFAATRLEPSKVGNFVLRITPEIAGLLPRAELAEEFVGVGLFSLSRALLRRSKSNAELLVWSVDDHGPKFASVSMGLLRRIFANSRAS